jgi:hypothetical protein
MSLRDICLDVRVSEIMSWTSYLQFWKVSGKLPRRARPRGAGRAFPHFRPSVETLEGRILPSTIFRVNLAGGEAFLGPHENNSGTVHGLSGSLVVGSGTSSGSLEVTAGSTLVLTSGRAPALFAETSRITGDRIIFQGYRSPSSFIVDDLYGPSGSTLAIDKSRLDLLDNVSSTGSLGTPSGGRINPPRVSRNHQNPALGQVAALPLVDINAADLIHSLAVTNTNGFAASPVAVRKTVQVLPGPGGPGAGSAAIADHGQAHLSDGTDVLDLSHLVFQTASSSDATDPLDLALSSLSGALRFSVTEDGREPLFPFRLELATDLSTDSIIATVPTTKQVPDEGLMPPDADLEPRVPIVTKSAERFLLEKGSPTPLVATLVTDVAEAERAFTLAEADPDGEFSLTNCLIGTEGPAPSHPWGGNERLCDRNQKPSEATEDPHRTGERIALVLACLFGPGLRSAGGWEHTECPTSRPRA